jgi:ABC-type Fe3+ transport system permease subunit
MDSTQPKKSFDYTTAVVLSVTAVVIVLLVITYRVTVRKSRALAQQQKGDQDAEAGGNTSYNGNNFALADITIPAPARTLGGRNRVAEE